ncbi:hypothetical protein ACWGNN_17430 [Streptomyces sp. NPDC055817]
MAEMLQARWESHRETVGPDEAVEIEPGPAEVRVSKLVREAMARGVTKPLDVLREVRLVQPEAQYIPMRSALQRERARLRRAATDGA